MKVNEIFLSIQGESLSSGFPTIFVRFTGCNLRCLYCDTTYAYEEGQELTPSEIYEQIRKLGYRRVCITGGEPLIQKDINILLELLDDYYVTIETNGSIPLKNIIMGEKHSFVMDMKGPSSGCSKNMLFENFNFLTQKDEIKFIIGNREDYDWAKTIIKGHYKLGTITLSPLYGHIEYESIIDWILQDKLDVRFQIQLHKLIWGQDKRGV